MKLLFTLLVSGLIFVGCTEKTQSTDSDITSTDVQTPVDPVGDNADLTETADPTDAGNDVEEGPALRLSAQSVFKGANFGLSYDNNAEPSKVIYQFGDNGSGVIMVANEADNTHSETNFSYEITEDGMLVVSRTQARSRDAGTDDKSWSAWKVFRTLPMKYEIKGISQTEIRVKDLTEDKAAVFVKTTRANPW